MRSFKARSLGTLVALVSLSTPSYAGQQAAENVRDFSVRLAANGVPAGVVVRESELVATGNSPAADPKGKTAFLADLPQLISEFNASNRSVRAVSTSSVIHVESTRLPDAAKQLLSREVFIDRGLRVPAGDAIFKTLMGLVRGSAVTAIAGTGLMPGPSCRLQDVVHLPRGTYTVSGYLDRVVTQLPGLVWLVTFEAEQPSSALKVGVVCPGGESLRMRIDQ
ncbi:MAG: hypothetical protein AB1635_15570 [Acidobacteriota bacterium]